MSGAQSTNSLAIADAGNFTKNVESSLKSPSSNTYGIIR